LELAGLAAKVAGASVVEGLGRGQERIEETKGISMVVLTGAEDNGAGRNSRVNDGGGSGCRLGMRRRHCRAARRGWEGRARGG
jgi:hypothetical protein